LGCFGLTLIQISNKKKHGLDIGIHWNGKNNHFRFSLFSLQDFFWKSGKVIFSLFKSESESGKVIFSLFKSEGESEKSEKITFQKR